MFLIWAIISFCDNINVDQFFYATQGKQHPGWDDHIHPTLHVIGKTLEPKKKQS